MTRTARDRPTPAVPLTVVAAEWGRIGCIGFGGPPTHIAMLRDLCVTRRRWLTAVDFEDAVVACNLLPGPASTQLAIYCASRVRGRRGALVGGLAFVVPGLVAVLVLAALFLGSAPPRWIAGAGAGAGAAVAAVAVHAAVGLVPASWTRAGVGGGRPWIVAAIVGAVAAATLGAYLVLVLLACGLIEMSRRTGRAGNRGVDASALPFVHLAIGTTGGLAAVAWTALKVGGLSYGGGFVIVPLMRADAVDHHRWMTATQFLDAVVLGQITPGPVVHTVAAVGYAAAGLGGGLLAAGVAFSPSFAFILLGGERFDRLRANRRAQAFLCGAGPAAIGAIVGSAVPLARSLDAPWQFGVLGAAAVALFAFHRSVVVTLLCAAVVGALVAIGGGPVPR